MTSTAERNYQCVLNALLTLYGQSSNKLLYFKSGDIGNIDTTLSSAIIGSHLPKIEARSPIGNGLVVEEYTERSCGASLWLIHDGEAG